VAQGAVTFFFWFVCVILLFMLFIDEH